MNNYPLGVTDKDISGRQCPQCGTHGCDCEDDGDPRTYSERVEDERDENRGDYIDRGQ